MEKLKKNLLVLFAKLTGWIKTNPLRTAGILLILVMLSGFFMPFLSFGVDLQVSGFEEDYTLLDSENSIVTLGLDDFLFQTPIDDIQVFDIPLSDLTIRGVSVLDIMRTPFPELQKLNWLNSVLSNPALDYLGDAQIQSRISEIFVNGDQINKLLNGAYNIVLNARSVESSLEVMQNTASETFDALNTMMADVDRFKTTLNELVFVLFFINLLLLLLMAAKNVSAWFPLVLSAVQSVLLIVLGLGINNFNESANLYLKAFTDSINSSIFDNMRQLIEGVLGSLGTMLVDFLIKDPSFISASVSFDLGSGYYVLTIFMLMITAVSIAMVVIGKKSNAVTVKLIVEPEEALVVEEVILPTASPEE
ncbi:hypothetical protein Q5O14_16925 [Eubacteriaceae bacterium ES2]|nr:hypothetical protein Q5O14_16925 [Eubacteriaceae bacterium ES2]